MAKAKSKAKTSVKAKSSSKSKASLPAGYKALDSRAPKWDFEKNREISGPRSAAREVTFDEGTKKERKARIMVVEDADLGRVTVWESAALRSLFDETEEGDEVFIRFTGYGTAKKGQNAPKLFETAVAA